MSSAQFAQKLSHMESGPRRIPRSEIVRAKPTSDDPVALCLELWKEWIVHDPDRDMGIKSMRMLTGDDVRNLDPSELKQLEDAKIGAATDAMIGSLSPIHKWAIYRSCSVSTVWNFPNSDFISTAIEARKQLEIKLRKNMCTSVIF